VEGHHPRAGSTGIDFWKKHGEAVGVLLGFPPALIELPKGLQGVVCDKETD